MHAALCAAPAQRCAELRLVWGQGIESLSGVPTSQDQVLEFTVRPAFTAKFSCERVNRDADCLPFLPMRLSFTRAGAARAQRAKIVLRGARRQAVQAHAAGSRSRRRVRAGGVASRGRSPSRRSSSSRCPATCATTPAAGSINQKRFPLTVKTDIAPPLAKFPARFGIIELQGRSDVAGDAAQRGGRGARAANGARASTVPGSVLRVGSAECPRDRRLDEARQRLRARRIGSEAEGDGPPVAHYAAAQSIFGESDQTRAIKVPKPGGARAFEVVGIPLKQPGFYVVELASPQARRSAADRRQSARQEQAGVSRVHRCAGDQSGRALQAGPRVFAGVGDRARQRRRRSRRRRCRCRTATARSTGTASPTQRGIARISKELPDRRALPGCFSEYDQQYMVFARSGARRELRAVRLERRHLALALQPAAGRATTGRTSRPRCSTARWCAPARPCT